MKAPRRIKLFKAYIRYQDNIYTLENCFLVKGRIAQLYKWRIRPIFANLTTSDQELVFKELKKSKGALTADNYQQLLPYMVKLDVEGRPMSCDLDDPAGPHKQWLFLHKAVNV